MRRARTRRRAWGVAVALAAVMVLAARPALAQDGEEDQDHRLHWREHWPRFRRSEAIYTGAAWAGYIAVEVFAEQSSTAR